MQMRIEEYEKRGLAPDEARRKARERIGNLALHHDRGYDVRGGGVIETVAQDIRYALRLLRKQPGFTATAIATLALGLGVSTVLFSVIDASLLRPLPFSHPEQLVEANITVPSPRSGRTSSLGPSLDDTRRWRALPAVAASAVVRDNSTKTLIDPGTGPERVIVNEVSEGYLSVCGLAPMLGRDVVAADVAAGAPPVVLIGYDYWISHYDASRDAIGRSIRFTEKWSWAGPAGVATIVGVAPKGFYPRVAMWRAQTIEAPVKGTDRRGTGTSTIIRLRAGVTIDEAARALSIDTKADDAGKGPGAAAGVALRSVLQETRSDYISTVNILSGAVGVILVIGCVNVAGLLLARGATRRQEFAIRASIGAGRFRLVRQLLTESVVLAVAGGLAGVFLAWAFLDGLVSLVPLSLPSSSAVAINGVVLTFALVLSLGTSILFGLVPAFNVSRVSLNRALGSGRQGSALTGRTGQLLIGVEVALAVVLVTAGGLLLNSFARANAVDVGLDPSAFVTIEATPVSQEPAVLTQYYRDLVDRIRALPGVEAVSAVDVLPMGETSNTTFFKVEGDPADTGATRRNVMPEYTTALGQAIVQGRRPSAAELGAGGALFMINETAARAWFPDGRAVGRSIATFDKLTGTIVGVVRDVRQDGPLYDPDPEVLVFSREPISSAMNVIVRPVPGGRVSSEALRNAAASIGPAVFVERVRSGSAWFADRIVKSLRRTLLFGLLGVLGLLLTVVGVFGITAYAVTRRTSEVAVRMALGAEPLQVVRQLVASSVVPAAIGAAVGLGIALWSTKAIEKFLFHVAPNDPATLGGVAVFVALAAGAAAWFPARRAAKVDPVSALREGA